MAASKGFTPLAAARVRAAEQIVKNDALFKLYEAKGGLKADLDTIILEGNKAETLNLAQSKSGGAACGATREVLEKFKTLQEDYSDIMAIVVAVRHDLAEKKAANDLLAALDRIIANEAPLTLTTLVSETGAKTTTARRSLAQEALRAEIAKDAGALVDLAAAHAALAARKVGKDRLEKLRKDAEALKDKLGIRVVKKGEVAEVTALEHAAVAAQSRTWAGVYRILAKVGRLDKSVRDLLRDAAR